MGERRIALVTGANRGIGLAVAEQLASEGLRVIVGAREAAAGEAVARDLPGDGHGSVALDVSDADSIRQALAQVDRMTGGPVAVLVNNAGIYPDGDTPGLEISPRLVLDTFQTNALGALRLAQALVPGMVVRRWGRIVNVSSGYGQMHAMGGGVLAYRMSKAALNMITLVLAEELRGRGVLVNAADPGVTRTRMAASAPRSPDRAAEGIAWLATLPDDCPTGGFFHDRTPIRW